MGVVGVWVLVVGSVGGERRRAEGWLVGVDYGVGYGLKKGFAAAAVALAG